MISSIRASRSSSDITHREAKKVGQSPLFQDFSTCRLSWQAPTETTSGLGTPREDRADRDGLAKRGGRQQLLDRQLRKDREYRWALGKRICCWLAGGVEVRGRLAEVADARLTIDQNGERVEVPRAEITKARLDAEVPWPRRG